MFRKFFVNMNEHAILEFLAYKSTKSPKTVDFYKSRLTGYAGFVGNAWPPTPDLVRSWLKHSQERGLKSGSVHANYRAARAWLNWLYRTKRIRENPIEQIDAPSQPKRKIPRAPKREEVEKLFEYLDTEIENCLRRRDVLRNWMLFRDMGLISFFTHTGVRIGELKHVQVEDVNLESGFVFVSAKGKDREERYIPIEADTRFPADIRLWLRVRSDIVNGSNIKHLFISTAQSKEPVPLGIWGFEEVLDKYIKLANVKRFTPHQLRHYYAVQNIRKGTDIMRLRDYMGHSSIAVTDIYLRSPDTWFYEAGD